MRRLVKDVAAEFSLGQQILIDWSSFVLGDPPVEAPDSERLLRFRLWWGGVGRWEWVRSWDRRCGLWRWLGVWEWTRWLVFGWHVPRIPLGRA